MTRSILFFCICLTIGFGTYYAFNRDDGIAIANKEFALSQMREQLGTIKRHILEYKKRDGHYPAIFDGLFAIRESVKKELMENNEKINYDAADYKNRVYYEYTYRRDYYGKGTYREDVPVLATDAGLISVYGLPYIYEDRNGLDESAFEFSPVNRDKERLFSVEIDKGVYVYAPYGEKACKEYNWLIWKRYLIWAAFIVILVTLIVLFIKEKDKNDSDMPFVKVFKYIGGTIALLASFFLGSDMFTLCYYMSGINRWHRERIPVYRELLEKYRANGIIKDGTYTKLTSALEKEYDNIENPSFFDMEGIKMELEKKIEKENGGE